VVNHFYLDSRGSKGPDAVSGLGVWIVGTNDNTTDPSGHNGLCAWRCASGVVARLKCDVHRSTCCAIASIVDCFDFSMVVAAASMQARPCHGTIGIEHDASDKGIGRDTAKAPHRHGRRSIKPLAIKIRHA
jgi:hypothetical protein